MDYQRTNWWVKDVPPPKQLYFMGRWDEAVLKNCATIVGSRRMTEYGRRVIEKLVPQLVLAGKTIVSGFMYGVDQYAHEVTLASGGRAVAVLGWGIANKLSAADKSLAERILETGGLLISEWEHQPAMLWTFPARDRILAALADEVYVVEAAAKSGSLITADWARRLKRKLYAVPGPITSRLSAGTNQLIASGMAQMWVGEVKPEMEKEKIKNPILKLLVQESLTANDVARKLKMPVAEVGAELSLLLLSGQITEKRGKYYAQ